MIHKTLQETKRSFFSYKEMHDLPKVKENCNRDLPKVSKVTVKDNFDLPKVRKTIKVNLETRKNLKYVKVLKNCLKPHFKRTFLYLFKT